MVSHRLFKLNSNSTQGLDVRHNNFGDFSRRSRRAASRTTKSLTPQPTDLHRLANPNLPQVRACWRLFNIIMNGRLIGRVALSYPHCRFALASGLHLCSGPLFSCVCALACGTKKSNVFACTSFSTLLAFHIKSLPSSDSSTVASEPAKTPGLKT